MTFVAFSRPSVTKRIMVILLLLKMVSGLHCRFQQDEYARGNGVSVMDKHVLLLIICWYKKTLRQSWYIFGTCIFISPYKYKSLVNSLRVGLHLFPPFDVVRNTNDRTWLF
jgi:hypothetical protein